MGLVRGFVARAMMTFLEVSTGNSFWRSRVLFVRLVSFR